MRNPKLWQIVLACYWLALFVATHIPLETPALQGGKTDKLAHMAAFAVLSALVAITWQLSAGRLTLRHLSGAWLVIVLYGAMEEWTQPLVGRHASIWDWMADAFGAAIGLMLFAWFAKGAAIQNRS
jgi:VanZ family protein